MDIKVGELTINEVNKLFLKLKKEGYTLDQIANIVKL